MAEKSLTAASHSGVAKNFDCVVWTAPVPDLFHIAGDVQLLIGRFVVLRVDIK